VESTEHLQGGGLAGAVRAEQSEDLTPPHGQIDAAYRLESAVPATQFANLDDEVRVHPHCHGGQPAQPDAPVRSRRYHRST
jgi:hypothetical protein